MHCQKPPVYTAESCSNESVFLFFSTKSEQTAIQQSHIINPLLTSFARSVRESIAYGFYRTDLAPSSLGLYENLRQYFPVQTSHSVNKFLLLTSTACSGCIQENIKLRARCIDRAIGSSYCLVVINSKFKTPAAWFNIWLLLI